MSVCAIHHFPGFLVQNAAFHLPRSLSFWLGSKNPQLMVKGLLPYKSWRQIPQKIVPEFSFLRCHLSPQISRYGFQISLILNHFSTCRPKSSLALRRASLPSQREVASAKRMTEGFLLKRQTPFVRRKPPPGFAGSPLCEGGLFHASTPVLRPLAGSPRSGGTPSTRPWGRRAFSWCRSQWRAGSSPGRPTPAGRSPAPWQSGPAP